jgi:hypothetical protein
MKKSKEEVEYSKGHLHSHCGPVFHDDRFSCRHFQGRATRMGGCEIVAGEIDPEYWCTEYQKAKVAKT